MGSIDTTALECVQEAMPHLRVCFLTSDGPALANARHVVRCWNSHYALLTSLRRCEDQLSMLGFADDEHCVQARAAIAAAEGRPCAPNQWTPRLKPEHARCTRSPFRQVGRVTARKAFHDRGNHSEIHLTEVELAVTVAVGVEVSFASSHVPALLAMIRQYASECAECNGTGTHGGEHGFEEQCDQCAEIRAPLAKGGPRPCKMSWV